SRQIAQDVTKGYLFETTESTPFLDDAGDMYRLYAIHNESGAFLADGAISSMLNLGDLRMVQAMNAATAFGEYNDPFATLLDIFKQKFYDEGFNGFYAEYKRSGDGASARGKYDAVPHGDTYFLDVSLAARLAHLILSDQYERTAPPSAAPAGP
ncbi:MAG: hypothetical protein ABI743_13515, partial [bacterium]